MSKKDTASIDRRDFFRRVGFGAGATAVGFSAVKSKAALPPKAQVKSAGYRVTDHVKKYYELARF